MYKESLIEGPLNLSVMFEGAKFKWAQVFSKQISTVKSLFKLMKKLRQKKLRPLKEVNFKIIETQKSAFRM